MCWRDFEGVHCSGGKGGIPVRYCQQRLHPHLVWSCGGVEIYASTSGTVPQGLWHGPLKGCVRGERDVSRKDCMTQCIAPGGAPPVAHLARRLAEGGAPAVHCSAGASAGEGGGPGQACQQLHIPTRWVNTRIDCFPKAPLYDRGNGCIWWCIATVAYRMCMGEGQAGQQALSGTC